MPSAFKSIWGQYLGVGAGGQLVTNHGARIDATRPCVDALIVVGDEVANVRAITIQLRDAYGKDIDYQEIVDIFVVGAANLNAIITTGGSTGIAIGTDGAILETRVAKKIFQVASEADGDIDLTWTDTGTEAAFLAVRLPNGRVIFSSALTNT
jgi:hypothetical protein